MKKRDFCCLYATLAVICAIFLISFFSGYSFTDSTHKCRGAKAKLLLAAKLAVFDDVFEKYQGNSVFL